jgi:4-aminobutyrate aminotransferase/(S)-3-amino-2-methylpropionate transaminase
MSTTTSVSSTPSTNAELMARRRAALPAGLGQTHEIFVQHADNAEVWDVEGKRYLDFAGGISVLNSGHRHPAVVAAVQAQLAHYTHTCFQVLAYEPYVALAEKLNARAPGAAAEGEQRIHWKSFFMTTGAEAVENAIKIARAATGRPGVIAFGGGFHGRTMMGLALTGKVSPYKKSFGPFPAEVYHAPFPSPRHGVSIEDSLYAIEHLFKADIEPSRVAAILLEPVQGEGGFHIAPIEWVQRLRQICDQHGILLIADEVQTCAGRTGRWLACEHWYEQAGIAPDLITMAKSMAGGMPISAVLGRSALMDAPAPGGLGGTYAGNPLACAAALAVMDVFESENLLERATKLGKRLRSGLSALQTLHPCIADLRGLGAMVAIELGRDGNLLLADADRTRRVIAEAARRGLILLSCGADANIIRLMVPLTASDAQLDEGLAILGASLEATA